MTTAFPTELNYAYGEPGPPPLSASSPKIFRLLKTWHLNRKAAVIMFICISVKPVKIQTGLLGNWRTFVR